MILKKFVAEVVTLSLIITAGIFGVFTSFEPQIIMAASDAENIIVTLNVTAGITLTSGGNITFTSAIDLNNNNAVGSTTLTTVTNDSLGYTLNVKAPQVPAMKAGTTLSIPDLTTTPGLWSSVLTGNATGFGFSGHNVGGITDLNTTTYGSDTTCGTVTTPSSNLKWRGFNGTTDVLLASRVSTTTTAGAAVVLCVAAGQSGTSLISATTTPYTTTITATATTN